MRTCGYAAFDRNPFVASCLSFTVHFSYKSKSSKTMINQSCSSKLSTKICWIGCITTIFCVHLFSPLGGYLNLCRDVFAGQRIGCFYIFSSVLGK